jgi:hypothetical protein
MLVSGIKLEKKGRLNTFETSWETQREVCHAHSSKLQ